MVATLVFSRFVVSFRPWGQAWPEEEVPSRLPLSPKDRAMPEKFDLGL